MAILSSRFPIDALWILEECVLAVGHGSGYGRTHRRSILIRDIFNDDLIILLLSMACQVLVLFLGSVLWWEEGQISNFRLNNFIYLLLRILLACISKFICLLRNCGGYFRSVLLEVLIVLFLQVIYLGIQLLKLILDILFYGVDFFGGILIRRRIKRRIRLTLFGLNARFFRTS